MKSIQKIILFLFLLSFHQILFAQEDECNKNTADYYVIKVSYLYQAASTESAILEEMEIGDLVNVIDSNPKYGGWWKVCYGELIGWVRKAHLSKNEPNVKSEEQEKSKDEEVFVDENVDIGFEPFLATTKSNANFRKLPSKSSPILKQVQSGYLVYVFSNTDVNGYYKVLDPKTTEVGWISNSLLEHKKNLEVQQGGVFDYYRGTSNFNALVNIKNNTHYPLTVILGKDKYIIEIGGSKNVYLSPGSVNCIATVPASNVIPYSATENVKEYSEYKWIFYIDSKKVFYRRR